jgi:hypothetical protein
VQQHDDFTPGHRDPGSKRLKKLVSKNMTIFIYGLLV